ncbi:uncharacterized protein LOC142178001 [Nicotiana tabacum]|uniref:Uncharacterized protein LOC142178001 n=1 Tax=Nicotiana tabacum TaxID=4097 RepID=A0AC58U1Q6_TOBAC
MDAGYNVYFANNFVVIKFNKRFICTVARKLQQSQYLQIQQQSQYLPLVPSKSVPSTPAELWTGCKPSLRHIRVWGCPAYVLKGKTDKFESRTEVCIFIGYPKGTKGNLFYCPKEKKVIVKTNAIFLEEDYLINHIPRSKLVLQELSNGVTNDSSLKRIPKASIDIPLHYRSGRNVNRQQNAQEQLPDITLSQSSGSNVEQPRIIVQLEIVLLPALQEEVNDIPAPQGVEDNIEASIPENDVVIQQKYQTAPGVTSRSGRIIKTPLRFALLREFYDRIPEETNVESLNYDEALHDTDADK